MAQNKTGFYEIFSTVIDNIEKQPDPIRSKMIQRMNNTDTRMLIPFLLGIHTSITGENHLSRLDETD